RPPRRPPHHRVRHRPPAPGAGGPRAHMTGGLLPSPSPALAPSHPETPEPPAEPVAAQRAEDYLAPALFALVAAVRRQADRVAGGGPDPDAIHDFRVALRRLRTVLRPARALYGERRLRA